MTGTKKITTDEAKTTVTKEIMKKMSTSPIGLSSEEASKRLKIFGPNEIVEKKKNPLLKFLGYFWGPIPWMIEVAAILSAIIQHWEDFVVILMMLMINAGVGFWQEKKADDTIELLKHKLATQARVLRDGNWIDVPARELVPGDMVRIRLGDMIPADLKLTEGDYLQTDESALTGESLPVEKKVDDVAYSGSIVRQGEMNGLVITTGMQTYFGKTAQLVEEAKTRSHFQESVVKIGNYLIIIAVVLVALVFVASFLRYESILETLQFSLVLLVAAIPVALPAVLSVTLAVGALNLTKRGIIVSKLRTIQELAGVDILCSDKTGTITKNEIAVADVIPQKNFTRQDVIRLAAVASREEDKDPIDMAIIIKNKAEHSNNDQNSSFETLTFKPFDPVTKRTEITIKEAGKDQFKVSKGAPQVILALIADKKKLSQDIDDQVNAFAQKGFRALGVAKTDSKGAWQFVGLIAFYDPPRDDSEDTITTAQTMGLAVKMMTGDHIAIAKQIAQQIKLGTNILQASSFLERADNEVQDLVEKADGFAQVFPEHKYHIVELLQKKNHIVGMTGDGVNDAPALKKADTGIAVAGATDAAKSAADLVLTDSGLCPIIDAIKQSRQIFERMNSYSTYRIAETVRVLFFLTFSILLFNFYPINAIMIVVLALLNDLPIMMIAFDNTVLPGKPVRWNTARILILANSLGILGVAASFGILYLGLVVFHLDPLTIQTLIFLKLAVAGHMTIYLTRTRCHSFWHRPLPAFRLFITTELTQLLATIMAVYGILMPAIGWGLAAFIWGYALLFFVLGNFFKIGVIKLMDRFSIGVLQ
ncbi:MAG: plasma-membrane proton-efflux P-type ATPase [Promethearchaeota archaeon]